MRVKEESCRNYTDGIFSLTDPGKLPYCCSLTSKVMYSKKNYLRTIPRPNPNLRSSLFRHLTSTCVRRMRSLCSLPSLGGTFFIWLLRPGFLPVSVLPATQIREIKSLAKKDPTGAERQIFRWNLEPTVVTRGQLMLLLSVKQRWMTDPLPLEACCLVSGPGPCGKWGWRSQHPCDCWLFFLERNTLSLFSCHCTNKFNTAGAAFWSYSQSVWISLHPQC